MTNPQGQPAGDDPNKPLQAQGATDPNSQPVQLNATDDQAGVSEANRDGASDPEKPKEKSPEDELREFFEGSDPNKTDKSQASEDQNKPLQAQGAADPNKPAKAQSTDDRNKSSGILDDIKLSAADEAEAAQAASRLASMRLTNRKYSPDAVFRRLAELDAAGDAPVETRRALIDYLATNSSPSELDDIRSRATRLDYGDLSAAIGELASSIRPEAERHEAALSSNGTRAAKDAIVNRRSWEQVRGVAEFKDMTPENWQQNAAAVRAAEALEKLSPGATNRPDAPLLVLRMHQHLSSARAPDLAAASVKIPAASGPADVQMQRLQAENDALRRRQAAASQPLSSGRPSSRPSRTAEDDLRNDLRSIGLNA